MVALIAITTICVLHRRTQLHQNLLGLSIVAVLSLLLTYHRVYDAAILLLPLAWVANRWQNTRRKTLPALAFLALACFLLPTIGLVKTLQNESTIIANLAQSAFWQNLVLPHQVWALLALTLILVYALITDRYRNNTPSPKT